MLASVDRRHRSQKREEVDRNTQHECIEAHQYQTDRRAQSADDPFREGSIDRGGGVGGIHNGLILFWGSRAELN